jgi:hypothetical protein
MTNSKYYKSKYSDKPIFKTGNLKIGYDTIIFNLSSATDCSSLKRGLCPLAKRCYALRGERRYKQLKAYRDRQCSYWDTISIHQFIADIGQIFKQNKTKIKYLRFNESGDINNIAGIQKMEFIAKWLKSEYGITTYTYTHRKDLIDHLKTCQYLVINGSGFMVDNNFTTVKNPSSNNICVGDCSICNKCKQKNYQVIEVKLH